MISSQPSALSTNPSPLRGWVGEYFVRSGTRRFGPYFARYWKENGKTHKQYIKFADLERIKAACQAYREIRREGTRIRGEFNIQSGNLKWLHRMNTRLEKGPIRDEDWAFMHVMKRNGFNISGRPLLRTPTIGNRQSKIATPQRLMVPSVTKRVMNKFQKTVARIVDERQSHETTRDKWKRWREEKKSQPPAPKVTVELPDWISEEHIEEVVNEMGGK